MSTLIITLPPSGADPAALFDYVQSQDGQHVSGHASVALAQLPSGHDEVVALLPAQALSWHQVQLPAGSVPRRLTGARANARLRSILDGALEDQLLDDPAQLHLALQPQANAAGLIWVVACDRAWLTAGLAALAQAGHAVDRIVPEYTPQSLQEQIVVSGEAESPRLVALQRGPAADGAAARPSGLVVVALNAQSLAWLGLLPDSHDANSLRVLAEPAVAALAEQGFKRPVQLLQRPERLLQAAQTPWDLAQFDLAHAARQRRWASLRQVGYSLWQAPQWRAARFALLALLLVNLLGLNAWALREQASLNAKRLALRTLLTSTFPKVPVVVDAPVQMAREVAVLQRASGVAAAGDVDRLLAGFAAVAPAGYAPTAIEFVANELRLKGPAISDPATLVSKLKAAGVRASQQGEQWLLSAGEQP